jgi:hypothetical protein
MAFVYIVRCNFSDPAKEQTWNDWYSGPKIAQMLRKPYFLSCQRFRRAAGTGRNYLALWVLQSPEAFKTKEYTSDWGFFEWQPCITDWSRDLFEAGDAAAADFAVPIEGGLHVMSFDGGSREQADAARGGRPGMTWLPIAGLDRHTPLIGVAVLNKPEHGGLSGMAEAKAAQEAVYRPISAFASAEKP